MANILITKIDTDCTTIQSVIDPAIRKKQINRIFAVIETFDGHHSGALEVTLTPSEVELFDALRDRIASRVQLNVTQGIEESL